MDEDTKEKTNPMAEDSVDDDDDIIRDADVEFEDHEDGLDPEEEAAAGGEEETPVEDNAVVVFNGHKEKPHAADEPPEVYSVHIDPSPSGGLVVTGGRDDSAYVWVMNSGQVVFECTGHKNSVTCVGFSHDAMYVASADLDGLIKVWKCSTKKEVWSYECGSDITWLQWHQGAHVLLAGTQGGEVWMWQVPSQDWSKMKMFQSHGHPSLCGKILPSGKHAVVGYGDGAVKLWDLKTGAAVHVWQHSSLPEEEMREEDSEEEGGGARGGGGGGEEGPEDTVAILCVDCSADNRLVMSGCADSTVKIYNVSSGKLVSAFNCAVREEDQDNSVESVAFCPVAPYAATATNSGAVEIWDLPTSVVRHTIQHPEGVSKLKWASSAPLLFTGCLDGITRLWDARSGKNKAELSGHTRNSCILDFDVTRDGTCLVSASEDGTARVFDLRFTQS
ncbi:angio-associated migratory cell protein-like [Babylonia areolata]|uniref:angio-associated migratory cell protein-like n=1 Tax=Babylonia areolata TaxID=304850 RepID=UPI003FD42608